MNSRQDGGPPYFPLNAIATGTPIAMRDGTQINQWGAHVAARRDRARRADRRLGTRSLLTFSITQRYAVEIDQWPGRPVDG